MVGTSTQREINMAPIVGSNESHILKDLTGTDSITPNSLVSMPLSFSYFHNTLDIIPKEITTPLAEFRKLVTTPKLCKDKDGAPLLSPAKYKSEDQRIENRDRSGNPTGIKGRQNANVEAWTVMMLDYDHQKEHPTKFLQPLIDAGLMFDAVPTSSNRNVCEKNPDGTEYFYRVFLYLNKAIPADKQPTVWSAIRALTGNIIDVQAKALEQMFFIPFITSADERLEIYANEGGLLDWESRLEEFEQEQALNKSSTSLTPIAQVASNHIPVERFETKDLDAAKQEFLKRKLNREHRIKQNGNIEYACSCSAGNHRGKSKTSGFINAQGSNGINITCNAQIKAGADDIKSILETEGIYLFPKETAANNLKIDLPIGAFKMVDLDQMEEIKPRQFLFGGRIVRGYLNGMFGEDKLKKSQIGIAMAAALSVGEGLFGEKNQPQGRTLIFTSEDDSRTVKERLQQFKHDLRYISVRDEAFTLDRNSMLQLKASIIEKNAVLVIIDAIDDFIGNIDAGKSNKVRAVLSPLNDIAKETNCAILIVGHTTKDTKNTNARSRIMNSAAFKSASRSVLFVARNPDDPNQGVLVHMDSNYAEKAESRTYLLGAVNFKWTGTSERNAENILSAEDVREDDRDIIYTTLMQNDGVMWSKQLAEELKPLGISTDMIKQWRRKRPDTVDCVRVANRWYTVIFRDGKTAREMAIERLSAEIK